MSIRVPPQGPLWQEAALAGKPALGDDAGSAAAGGLQSLIQPLAIDPQAGENRVKLGALETARESSLTENGWWSGERRHRSHGCCNPTQAPAAS